MVVQGGTFYNEAVLRAFEKEMGVEVIRPDIAGLMGAYGAALYGMGKGCKGKVQHAPDRGGAGGLPPGDARAAVCRPCGNNCQLTVNTFSDGGQLISGNRCERPVTGKKDDEALRTCTNTSASCFWATSRRRTGAGQHRPAPVPEFLGAVCPSGTPSSPSWAFRWCHSPMSSRKLYLEGQGSIPSDTACFPAKLAHGHIEFLAKLGVDAIFYPCMTYNIDEGLGENHYNCPVVAYYPEVLAGNCRAV